MPTVKTYYFNFKALGEGQRLLLSYGGEDFEDVRITQEEWPEFRKTTNFGQLPLLEIDGKQYAQSNAICRYLGRKYGLAGDTLEEDLEIDQIVDFFQDLRVKLVALSYEPDEAIKQAKREDYSKNLFPFALTKLHDAMKDNNGYLAAGKLSWGDFMLAGYYDCLKVFVQDKDFDTKYPLFKKHRETVFALPQLQEYLKNAPETEL